MKQLLSSVDLVASCLLTYGIHIAKAVEDMAAVAEAATPYLEGLDGGLEALQSGTSPGAVQSLDYYIGA